MIPSPQEDLVRFDSSRDLRRYLAALGAREPQARRRQAGGGRAGPPRQPPSRRSVVAVSPPGWSKRTWYDEMLGSDDTIVVIGHSYEAGGTELGLFDFDSRTGDIK